MREIESDAGPWHDEGTSPILPLSALALLYAAGELDEDEAAAFEKRLGEDQAVREALAQAVRLVAGRVITEASGGVNLDTVRAIAEAGVDLISVGALTHSAPVLDIGLDIEIGTLA